MLTCFEFSCSRLNRAQHQNLENHLINLCHDVSSMSLERRSERIATFTDSLLEPEQHRKAVRAEILRIACSISNPLDCVGFENAAIRALDSVISSMENKPSKDILAVGPLSQEERNAKFAPQDGLVKYDTWRKDCLT